MIYLAVIGKTPELLDACAREALPFRNLSLRFFEDSQTFLKDGRGFPFHAVLVDLAAFLAEPARLRERIHELEANLPVLVLRWSGATGSVISAFKSARFTEAGQLLEALSTGLRETQRVVLRKHERRSVILNARLVHPRLGADPYLTHVTNLSEGGAFVICNEVLPIGEVVALEIIEIGALSRFVSTVRWCNDWGRPGAGFSGLGLEFEAASSHQMERIRDLLELDPYGPGPLGEIE